LTQPLVISIDAMGGDHGPSVIVPAVAQALAQVPPNVTALLHGDEAVLAAEIARCRGLTGRVVVRHTDKVVAMGADDFDTEYMALIVTIHVVAGVDEAIAHINEHGGHTEVIISQNQASIDTFVHQVDATAVMVNASTRFNDGGQLGLGAEIAISTQKLHVRGPMGLRELTTYKWVVQGEGQIRR